MSNFLFILADDMRADELKYMPNTRRLLGQGTTFTNCRTNAPICGPTRVGIITGQLSRYHGQTSFLGAPDATMKTNSSFKALDNAGYRVGFIGKWPTGLDSQDTAPAGFDYFQILKNATTTPSTLGAGIYDAVHYRVRDAVAGTESEPAVYQEHYMAGLAVDFVRGTEPWCLWYCPTANHWPLQDPPNHTTEWAYRDFPIVYETDVSDKPSWIQAKAAVDGTGQASLQAEQRIRLRELLALDDTVTALVGTIMATGNWDDTTIIFTSDNGMMLGEHRWTANPADGFGYAESKNCMYDPALLAPMVVRGPDFPHQTVTVPVQQQDAVAAMLDIAGATALTTHQTTSLRAISQNPAGYSTRAILHYRGNGDGNEPSDPVPTADAMSNATRKLVRYQGQSDPDKYEMYDLDTDPNELTNVAYVGGRLSERNTLEAVLDGLLA